jgi:hypothetical protein
MHINSFIMSDKAQEVPIPVPGEEITTGISWSMSNITFHYRLRHIDAGTYQMLDRYTIGTKSAYPTANTWYENTGWLPVNLIADGNGCDLYIDSQYQRSDRIGYADIQNIVGSVTVSVSGLQAGKYVVVLDHYIGGRSQLTEVDPYDYALEETDLRASKIIRPDTNGITYGQIIGVEKYNPEAGYDAGDGWVVHYEQRSSITVEEGDTSKTISFGGDGFAQSALCATHHYNQSDNMLTGGLFYQARYGVRTRLYTEGRG